MAYPTDVEEERALGRVIDEGAQDVDFYPKKKTIHHPRFYVYLEKPDGTKKFIGRGLRLTVDWDYALQPVPEAGLLGPQEYVETNQLFTLRAQTFRVFGIKPEDLHFRLPYGQIIYAVTLTLVVKDPVTKKVLDKYEGVKLGSGSITWDVNAIVVQNAVFRAVGPVLSAIQT